MAPIPLVSIVIPCRNEATYIGSLLESVVRQTYPHDALEVLVVDGDSDDRTPEVVKGYHRRYPWIRLLHNPERYVPHAMNRGIRAAKGAVIIRMDAHADYPSDYVEILVRCLQELGADNVGGVLQTLPGADTLWAHAIALATSHPFGVGNAHFRIASGDYKKPLLVDTVPFGCYPRSVFDRIGWYDEDLIRNQDDELNARLIRSGGKIFLLPWLRIRYYARKNLVDVARMFYQYGYFKPLVSLKVGRPATWRQFVPAFFVLGLLFPLMAALAYWPLMRISVAILALHSLVNAGVSGHIAWQKGRWKLWPYLWVVFLIIHTAYGWGYLRGMIDFYLLKKHRHQLLEAEITRSSGDDG